MVSPQGTLSFTTYDAEMLRIAPFSVPSIVYSPFMGYVPLDRVFGLWYPMIGITCIRLFYMRWNQWLF
jgi:hypothetical protein